jgi:glycerate dehydrogenase
MSGFQRTAVLPGTSLTAGTFARLREHGTHDPVRLPTAGECVADPRLHELLTSVDALLCGWSDRVTGSFLRLLPRLRYIGVRGTSTHRIDLDYAALSGVTVEPIHNYGDIGTTEFVVQRMLAWARTERHAAGQPMSELAGRQLGLLGYGSVAAGVARVAGALAMEVRFFTPRSRQERHVRWCPVDEVLAGSDIVSFHTPAYSVVVNRPQLELIRPSALVVVTTLGLPFATSDFTAWQRNRPGRVVLDLCATQGAPASVFDLPGVEVAGYFAARTAESIARAERALLANLRAAGELARPRPAGGPARGTIR